MKPERLGERAECVAKMIPTPVEIDGYEDSSFYWNDNFFMFDLQDYCQYSVCLELKFNQSAYSAAKEEVISSYDLLEEARPRMPITETEIGNYTVLIVEGRKYPDDSDSENEITSGPTSIGFLAFIDKKMKIRYGFITNHFLHPEETEEFFIDCFKMNFSIGWR